MPKNRAPNTAPDNPVGKTTTEAAASRASRSTAYRNAREEYARIRELRKIHPIAAHLRERRLEALTQEQVGEAADTTGTAISRMEKGETMPKLSTLQRIAAVLDEELLLCFRRTDDAGEIEQEFAAVA